MNQDLNATAMLNLGISVRTVNVLQKNEVNMDKLMWWQTDGKNVLTVHLLRLPKMGRVRAKEVVKAIYRGLRSGELVPLDI